jgi:hypothetical protein
MLRFPQEYPIQRNSLAGLVFQKYRMTSLMSQGSRALASREEAPFWG